MKRSEIAEAVNSLTVDDHFGITFKKKNGEIRTYNDCQVHVKPTNPTGTGITAKRHLSEYNNLQFFKNDEDPGYRIAYIPDIIEVVIKGVKHTIID